MNEDAVNGTLINATPSYKYLGVTLDLSLNLESHFDKMYKRAAGRRFNLLRRASGTPYHSSQSSLSCSIERGS